ncbi:MAG: DUF1987 domain-containing protein [Bacteroidales bacterium]|nr:DUF1987 domain-containing protein [Bacteroidales bacterium]
MESLHIAESAKSPFINFDCDNGFFEIRGRSIIENTFSFYEPVFKVLSNYVKTPADKTTVHLSLDYYNTSSQIWIYNILKEFNKINDIPGKELNITWFYSDSDLLDAGKDFQNVSKVPIELKEAKEGCDDGSDESL